MAHEGCKEVIKDAWSYQPPNGSPMFKLFEKIKRCKTKLVAWSREVFGNAIIQIEEKQVALMAMNNTEYGNNLAQINILREEINTLLHQEEVFWRQLSRAIWLPASDKNTKFFHKRASQRRRKNQIEGLMNREGVWRTSELNVGEIAEEYFKNIFATSNPSNVDGVLDVVDEVVMEEMN